MSGESDKVNLSSPSFAPRSARIIAALACSVLISTALAVSGARGAAGSGALHGSGDLSGVVLDCSTDTITLTGAYDYTEVGFVNQLGNGVYFSHGSISFNLAPLSGTGRTGASYRVVGATNLDYAFTFGSAAPGTDVEHTRETWQLVPSGGGAPLSFRENFVFVISASGSTTLVDHGPSDCS